VCPVEGWLVDMTGGTSSGTSGSTSSSSHLRRSLSLTGATMTSTGLAFAVIDYIAVVSILAYTVGVSAWLAVLIAGFLVLIVSGLFSELNGLYPTAAGIRLYMTSAMGERKAMITTFTYLTSVVLVIAADAFLIGSAIQHVLGGPSIAAYGWIVLLLALAVGGNLFGVRMAGAVQTIVTSIVLVSTFAVSVVAIATTHGSYNYPLGLFHKGIFHGVQALIFAVFLYAAFEWVTTAAEEVRKPAVITRALFIAPVILFIVAGVFSVALAHAVPHTAMHNSAYPQLLLGKAALGEAGMIWMLGATMVAAMNTFNGGFLVASRFIYAAAREGILPRVFARLNMKAVPWVAVLVLGVSSGVIAAAVFATRQWLLLVAVGSVLEAGIYAVAGYCVVRLRRKEADRARPFTLKFGRPLGIFAMVVFGILTVIGAFSDPRHPSHLSLLPFLVVAVLGLLSTVYVVIFMPKVRAKAAARVAASKPRRRPPRANITNITDIDTTEQ